VWDITFCRFFLDSVFFIPLNAFDETLLGVIDYQQFENQIKELLEGNGVKIFDLTLQIIVPPIMEFVIWLRTL